MDTAEHLHHTPIGKTDRAEPLSEVPPAQPSATEGKELETEEGPSMKPLEPPDRLLSKTSGFTFIGIVAAVGVATHLLNR